VTCLRQLKDWLPHQVRDGDVLQICLRAYQVLVFVALELKLKFRESRLLPRGLLGCERGESSILT